MKRILPKIVLALLLMNILSLSFLATSKADKTVTVLTNSGSYVPGVKAGDWALYDVAANYTTNDPNPSVPPPPAGMLEIEFFKITVQSVQDAIITFRTTMRFKNGTEYSSSGGANIASGPPPFPTYFTAANLSAGDPLLEGQGYLARINATLQRSYAGAEREVNYFSQITNTTSSYPKPTEVFGEFHIYWDRSSGVLTEMMQYAQYTDPNGGYVTRTLMHLVMRETNVWAAIPSVVPVQVFFTPRVLNLRDHGKWFMAFVVLPRGITGCQVDRSVAIMINSTVPEVRHSSFGRLLMVKFDRAQVEEFVLNNVKTARRSVTVTLTVAGMLKNGTVFQGSNTVRVILPKK